MPNSPTKNNRWDDNPDVAGFVLLVFLNRADKAVFKLDDEFPAFLACDV
jgi:hypothetical protein